MRFFHSLMCIGIKIYKAKLKIGSKIASISSYLVLFKEFGPNITSDKYDNVFLWTTQSCNHMQSQMTWTTTNVVMYVNLKITLWRNVYKFFAYLKILVTIEIFINSRQHGTNILCLVQNQVRFKKIHKLVFNETSMAIMATNGPDLKQIQLVFSPFHESLHFLLYILSFNNNVCSMKKLFTNFNYKFFSFWQFILSAQF
jgi:hypothetical protein